MFVGGYWGPRKESANECAARIRQFIERAALVNTHLSTWYPKSYSASSRGRSISTEKIQDHLATARTDTTREAMPEVGFSLALWNGDGRIPVSFSANCGGYAPTLRNSVVLRFRSFDLDNPPIPLAGFLELVLAVQQCFDTEVSTLTSTSYLRAQGSRPASEVGGWITLRREGGLRIAEEVQRLMRIGEEDPD